MGGREASGPGERGSPGSASERSDQVARRLRRVRVVPAEKRVKRRVASQEERAEQASKMRRKGPGAVSSGCSMAPRHSRRLAMWRGCSAKSVGASEQET